MNTHANVNYLKRFVQYLFFSLITLIVLAGGAQAAIQCYECHGVKSPVDHRPVDAPYRNITTGGLQGNHRTHMDSIADPATCTKCHNNAGYTSSHRDGRVQFSANINSSPATGQYNVSGSPVTFKNQTSIPVRGSCSNANCHFEALTPTWGSAVLGAPDTTTCATCHNALPVSNAHTKHITKYGNDLTACTQCHPNHAGEGKPFQHATSAGRNIAVTAGNYAGSNYNYLPSQAGSRTVGVCSNFYCHSDGTRASAPFTANQNPSWADVGNITCKSCHGGPAALGSNILASGKHTAHMNNAAVTGDTLGCVECHAKTVTNDSTIGTPANHANAFRDYSGVKAGGSGSYVTGTGVCSATYCHTDGKGTQKSMSTDNWKAATTLDCKGCHGSDAAPAFASVAGEPNYANGGGGAATANSHQKHAASGASTCANCHSKTTSNGTAIIAGSQHLDKFINYTAGNGKTYGKLANKTCSNISCHSGGGIVASVADAQWGATLNCNGCHGDAGTLATGKHTAHVNGGNLGNFGCVDCHAKTVTNNTTIGAPANHMNSFVDYSGVKAGKSATYATATGVCSATYCHTDGKGTQNVAFTDINGWKTAATLDCKGCHGNAATPAFTSQYGEPNSANAGAGLAGANSHQKHVATGVGAAVCARCHSKTTTDGTTIIASSQHVDKLINYTSNIGLGYTYGKLANKTCSNISCHSGGGIVASVADAQWGATLNCNGCHGGPVSAGAPILASGKHTAHMNNADITGDNLGCVECHAKTVTNDSTIGTPANHANAFRDYSGVKAGGSGSYVTGTGVCSATYCHTDGKGTQKSMSTDNWKAATTLDCKGCHGSDAAPAFASVAGEPNYANGGAGAAKANSHQKHAADGASACANCHSKTTSNGTAIIAGSQHLDKFINYTAGNGKTYGKLANKTCSNISCHSGGGIVASVADAQWGATLTCAGCHGDAGTLTTGAHTKHLALSGVTCNYCHNATASDNTTISTPANHANTSITINFNASAAPAGGTYNDQTAGGATVYQKANGLPTGACATSLCHGGNSDAWGVANTDDTCVKCHGAAGTASGSLTKDNRYLVAPPVNTAGTQGTLTGNGQVSNDPKVGAHQTHLRFLNGFSNYSTVDFRCENCHGTLPTSFGTHANGSSAPAFQGMATNRSAMSPTFNATNLTCSNTYCHNPAGTGGTLDPGNAGLAIQPSWTSASYIADGAKKTQANCNRCHKSPGDASFAGFNHGATTIADDCSGCHGHNGDTAGIAGQRHLDGRKYGGGNCDSCHGYGPSATDGKSQRAVEGKGAHEKHVAHLVARWGGTLNPATDLFGSGASWTNVCGVCHDGAVHDTSEAIGGTGRTISIPAASYQFGPSAPVYNGAVGVSSATTPKSCSNVSCHFKTTPVWSSY